MRATFHFQKKQVPWYRRFFCQSAASPLLLAIAVDRLIDPLAVKMTEKKYQTDQYRSAPYGKFEEIVKGEQSDLSKEARYLGSCARKCPSSPGTEARTVEASIRTAAPMKISAPTILPRNSALAKSRPAEWRQNVMMSISAKPTITIPGDRTKLRITGTVA